MVVWNTPDQREKIWLHKPALDYWEGGNELMEDISVFEKPAASWQTSRQRAYSGYGFQLEGNMSQNLIIHNPFSNNIKNKQKYSNNQNKY